LAGNICGKYRGYSPHFCGECFVFLPHGGDVGGFWVLIPFKMLMPWQIQEVGVLVCRGLQPFLYCPFVSFVECFFVWVVGWVFYFF
jgi:hypothetical protein